MSARALRDAEDFDEMEEPWLVTPILRDESRPRPGSGLGPASGLLIIVLIIFVVLVAPPSRNALPAATVRPRPITLLEKIRNWFPGAPTFDLRDDFHGGLRDWVGNLAQVDTGGWKRAAGKIRLGRLRLWKPTLAMTDYQMSFQGQIERKAMGWAFRATDLNHYYAAKLAVPGPGGPSQSEIIRYVVVNGKKTQRVELPLPIVLKAGTPYQVRVQVEKDRFSTLVNGQVVDTWVDNRYRKGGIGFFSEPGELALISWVRVTDGQGLFARLFSSAFLVGPPQLLGSRPPGF